MKRIVSMLLVLCFLIVLLPIHAKAATIIDSGEWGQDGSDVYWSLDSDGNMTITGTGAMLDCYYIGSVGTKWFRVWDRHLQNIKTVTIEEGITYVGNESFSGASNLTKITIADSVTEIGWHAFSNCDSLVDIHLGTGLKKMNIEVFSDCDALESFTFPDCAVEYGNHLFVGCDKLNNVVFSDKITKIPDGMFEECISLQSILIPSSITYLGFESFAGCTGLKKLTIPESVTEIHDKAFAYCSNLEEISLPNTLIQMGSSVFDSCLSLETITVPEKVTTMAHTFDCAYGLKSVKFIGNAPVCGGNLFGNLTITAYYPSNNPSWTETVRQDYGGNVTWVSYESDITPSNTLASGTCGDNASWVLKNDFTLVISGTGKMEDYWSYEAPWHDYVQRIEHVIIEPGITNVGNHAFIDCRTLMSVSLPNSITHIGASSFHNCINISALEIPESVVSIDHGAFSGCIGLEYISFLGDAPQFGDYVFREVTTTAFYPAGSKTWVAEITQDYGGKITWVKKCLSHTYTSVVTKPTCMEPGYTTHTCSKCGDEYKDAQIAATGHTWKDNNAITKVCVTCGYTQTGYQIPIDASVIKTTQVVWVDGAPYNVSENGGKYYVTVPSANATNLIVYTYNDPSAKDLHTQYPIGMKVWTLKYQNGAYTTSYIKEFDNLLQYSGSSIRITGTKGIRMITSITKANKNALTTSNLAGYTLLEYGTALAWASDLEGGKPLVLEQPYTKSNYAYKKGVADPVFKDTGKLVQYTNVLVGFDDDKCIPDIAMRPYIILKDASGNEVTIYGGIIYRSIGYIAYQNRNTFQAKSNSYEYVWGIIHHVYGKQFDTEYKG